MAARARYPHEPRWVRIPSPVLIPAAARSTVRFVGGNGNDANERARREHHGAEAAGSAISTVNFVGPSEPSRTSTMLVRSGSLSSTPTAICSAPRYFCGREPQRAESNGVGNRTHG